jgi:hypothetical protein
MAQLKWPFRVCVRAARGIRAETSSVKIEHGDEVVVVSPVENPTGLSVKVCACVCVWPSTLFRPPLRVCLSFRLR